MSQIIDDISIKNIAKVAIPIMISALSFNLMIFVNRVFLAHYDLVAMNSAAAIGLTVALFQYSFIGIAGMSEVVSGRLNGAREYKDVASPAWQMIWFGLFSALLLTPLGIFGGKYIIANDYMEHGLPFFQILMSSIFLSVICHGINGFFVAIGKTKIITISTLAGNLVNILLDYILIFGAKFHLFGHEVEIESMGTAGAAIATSVSMVIQLLIVGGVFLSTKYNKKYNTRSFSLHFEHFKECFKIGYPNAVSHFIEISAWNAVFFILTLSGQKYVAIHTININFFLLIACVNDGIQKAVVSFVSNLVGADQKDKIEEVVEKAILLIIMLLSIISSSLYIFIKPILIFIFDIDPGGEELIDIDSATEGVKWVLLFLMLDGISWIMCAVMMGLGDTKFMMYTNGPLAWMVVVIPLWVLQQFHLIGLYTAWQIVCIYPVIYAIIGRWRYRYHLRSFV
jgi:MATE family multidrug resistance protein